ncbi:MAG: hypothetical protein DHS20C05_14550 [Hyphococcus sp.]|nr:MAG: hypothetical protein DHS20C05_14550 [Marinicaulis sp.]
MTQIQRLNKISEDAEASGFYRRLWDALIFIAVLIVSALAILAVALVTPFLLVISVLAGLLTKQSGASSWRPAGV